MAGNVVTVMLVDDHPVVRNGYGRLLNSQSDISVVAELADGESACVMYPKHRPDVVVLDLNMPGIGGLETIRRLKAKHPDARILVFSMHDSRIMVARALEAGAAGYLEKSSSTEEMIEAIRTVSSGRTYLDHDLPQDLKQVTMADKDPVVALTRREFQVFCALAEGKSISEIADSIYISAKTAGVHQTRLMKKLNLKNVSELTRLAIQSGIVVP